jgi:hypothetical protein
MLATHLDREQNNAAKFALHRNDSNWDTLAQHRKIVRICALFKAYTEEGLGTIWVIYYKCYDI